MNPNSFPFTVANLITEDPNVINEHRWPSEFEYEDEELFDKELLGDYLFDVKYSIGAAFSKGEPMVRYLPGGGGYPGSPAYWEWEITNILDAKAFDENTGQEVPNFQLTPEWKKRLIAALDKKLDDREVQEWMSNDASGYDDEPEPDYRREY